MWKMLDPEFECGNDCSGPGPPPEFIIPPPPRPLFLRDTLKCGDDNTLLNADMCSSISIIDPSFHSSPSLQASAMIILCSVILVLVILISSLLVWKHKRKVHNVLPCKTPTRGHPLGGNIITGHAITYDDPDLHLGHHPLVMGHHHDIEMIRSKAIHYPSGFPISRTPPLFSCSSPGPDPYRSNDNVYEELGPPRDSDIDSDPPLHSDDDFAEDELSLPGDRSFQNTSPDTTTLATIYQERGGSHSNADNNGNENDVSSNCNPINEQTNDKQVFIHTSPPKCVEINRSIVKNTSSPGVFRSRKVYSRENHPASHLNSSTISPKQRLEDNAYAHTNMLNKNTDNNTTSSQYNFYHHPESSCNNFINNDINRNDLIDRRNHLNSVATIYLDQPASCHRIYHPTNTCTLQSAAGRSRTNPRSSSRHQLNLHQQQKYNDDQSRITKLFHDGILYNSGLPHHPEFRPPPQVYHHSYILPEYTSFRTLNTNPHTTSNTMHIYSPSDSSFGSDSGYSQNTQSSNRGSGIGGSLLSATFSWPTKKKHDNKNGSGHGS